MPLVAGVDTSTQSCKVLIVDAETGVIVRQGSAAHPDGTEVHPDAWWDAFNAAVKAAGGLDDVAALSVGGQQHGMVALDADGEVIRPALLWNDTRSAQAALDLRAEFPDWAAAIGSVPVASLTVTKLRWLADAEPENAARLAAVCLPHDWLTWRIAGSGDLGDLITDRSDASGTGYFDSVANEYRRDLLSLALRRDAASVLLPRVLGPADHVPGPGMLLGAGCGDNAGAALGLDLFAGQTSLSLGTSGVVASVSPLPTADASGLVTGFADAAGGFLPLACTLNASRVLDAARRLLGVDHEGLSRLALAAEPGAGGLVQVPWFEGERTPNLPHASAATMGMTLANTTRENFARAAVEGMLCLMGAGIDAISAAVEATRAAIAADGGAVDSDAGGLDSIRLIGGAAKSEAVRLIAPEVLAVPIVVPEPGEYVALGAARQASWALTGERPSWAGAASQTFTAEHRPEVAARYREAAAQLSGLPWNTAS